MQTLDALRRSLATTRDLTGVVRTMKTLAAVNIRQYEGVATALHSYAEVVEQGLQIALRHRPALFEARPDTGSSPSHPTGTVVFGSDTGLCGRFNEQIVDFAVAHLAAQATESPLLVLGLRAGAGLAARGYNAECVLSLPNSLATLTVSVQAVLQTLQTWVAHGAERLVLCYHRLDAAGAYGPHALQLYPLDAGWLSGLAKRPWPSRSLPTYSMDWEVLFAALVREYLFVTCYRALTESLASENAARLSAMQAAEDNLEARLGELGLEFHQQRQRAITEELLDIIAGADALTPLS